MRCPVCNGKGYLEFEHGLIQLICDKCKGTGEVNSKRRLSEETKQKNSGIYKIQSLINGKQYIGSAVNLAKRKSQHLNDLRMNRHCNKHLQSAFNLYGEESFVFEVLEYCESKDLIKREQYYIEFFHPEYNVCSIADSPLGIKRTEETKRKMSEVSKGKSKSEEHKKHISEAMKGNKYPLGCHPSKETKQKMSEAQKGRLVSEETRIKMSEANKGKHLSNETKQKIKESMKGNTNKKNGKYNRNDR